MSLRLDNNIINQKQTPAFYSDVFANRPAAGFLGRVFISTDTGQIFEDNGTSWVLIADAGVGGGTLSSVCINGNTTATGIVITAGGLNTNTAQISNLTQDGGVLFTDASGNLTQDVNFNWDATNNSLGIGNTGTPTAPLDIHNGTVGVQIQLNATSTNNSTIAFQNAGVGKWRVGNLYSAGANLFHIYNTTAANNAMTINSSNAATFTGSVTASSLAKTGGTSSQFLKADGSVDSSSYITLTSLSGASPLVYNNSTGQFSILQSGASQSGYLSSTDWNTFNNKASLTAFSASSPLIYNNSTGAFSIQVANAGQSGYLTSTDWNTFNNKQSALTFGNLTEAVSSVLTITGGTGAVIGSGTSIQISQASSIQSGYLSSTDWNTFNNKATALNGVGFVKANGTTISYDNSTYYLASNPSNFITLSSLAASSPLVYNNTSGGFSIQVATTSQNGYLSSTDWNTFNNKQGSITLTTTGSSGAATFIGNTLNIPNYGSALSGYLPLTGGTLTGTLNIQPTSSNGLVIKGSGTTTGTYGLYVQNNASTTEFYVNDAGSIYMASNVGIGTNPSSSYLLNVNGTLNVTGAATYSSTINAGGNITSNGTITSNNINGVSGFQLTDRTNGVLWLSYANAGNRYFYNSGSGNVIYFTQSGAANFSSDITATRYQATSSSASLVAYGVGTGLGMFNLGTSLGFATSSNERMRIVSNGTIGINTSTCPATFNIKELGLSGAPLFRFYGNASNGDYMRGAWYSNDQTTSLAVLNVNGTLNMEIGTIANMPFQFYTNNAERMRITGNGQFGFNTSTPFNAYTFKTGGGNNLDIFDTGGAYGIGMQAVNDTNTAYKSWDFYASKFQFLNGNVLINSTTDNGAAFQVNGKTTVTVTGSTTLQTLVGSKTAAASGTPISVAYIGHTNAITVNVYAIQSTSNVCTAIANITTAYGSSNGGVTGSSKLGNITGITVAYNNSGYYLDITLTYTGTAPTIYWTIQGINNNANIYAL